MVEHWQPNASLNAAVCKNNSGGAYEPSQNGRWDIDSGWFSCEPCACVILYHAVSSFPLTFMQFHGVDFGAFHAPKCLGSVSILSLNTNLCLIVAGLAKLKAHCTTGW